MERGACCTYVSQHRYKSRHRHEIWHLGAWLLLLLQSLPPKGGHRIRAAARGGGEEVRGGVRAGLAMRGVGPAGAANAKDCSRHDEVRGAYQCTICRQPLFGRGHSTLSVLLHLASARLFKSFMMNTSWEYPSKPKKVSTRPKHGSCWFDVEASALIFSTRNK